MPRAAAAVPRYAALFVIGADRWHGYLHGRSLLRRTQDRELAGDPGCSFSHSCETKVTGHSSLL
jgi:hypothetical protein